MTDRLPVPAGQDTPPAAAITQAMINAGAEALEPWMPEPDITHEERLQPARDVLAAAYPLISAQGAAAEREAIRGAVFGCADCGSIHPERTLHTAGQCDCGTEHLKATVTRASPGDGHPYAPRYARHGNTPKLLADLLEGTPPPPHPDHYPEGTP